MPKLLKLSNNKIALKRDGFLVVLVSTLLLSIALGLSPS